MQKSKEILNSIKEKFNENPFVKLIVVLVVFFIIVFIIKLIFKIIKRIENYRKGSPILVETIKSAKKRKVIRQYSGSKYIKLKNLLRRSKNEWGGIEFSYRLWFYIDDWTYKYGTWKHIFHKGNADSWPNRAPGAWFHPKKNILRVYMNTYREVAEYMDIPNIPIQKWVHLTVVCKDRSLLIYINGQLRSKKLLSSIPKQNYGDLYINSFGGFSGYISRMVYHDFALSSIDVKKHIAEGPSKAPCPGTNITPPYLSTNWWQLNYN